MKSIILIGMPGCGKSTIGVILAKELGLDFIDTDIVIQNMTGELLYKTLEKEGVSGLLDREQEAICSMDMSKPLVISTGGSAVLRKKSMEHLLKDGVCVYLKLPLCEIEKRIRNKNTRGIAAEQNETLRDIYNYRTPFYEKYAHIVCDCSNKQVWENVENVKKLLSDGMFFNV